MFGDFVQACASAQEFMQRLPEFDQMFAKKLEEAENAGEVSNSLRQFLFPVKVTKRKFALTTSSMHMIHSHYD